MAPKVLFLVLLAFLASSALANSEPIENGDNQKFAIGGVIDNLIELAEQILLGVNKLINEAIYEVAYGIRTLFESLDEFSDFGIQLTEQVIEKEFQVLNALIEKYKNQTSETGQDILQCIEDTEDEAASVQDQAVNSSLGCIDAEIQRIGDGLLQILVDIRNLNEQVAQEEENLETCKNQTATVDCIKDVLNNLVEIATSLATVIETDADNAQEDFDNLGAVIQQCINDTAAFIQNENERVFNDFSECVYNKEHSSTSASLS